MCWGIPSRRQSCGRDNACREFVSFCLPVHQGNPKQAQRVVKFDNLSVGLRSSTSWDHGVSHMEVRVRIHKSLQWCQVKPLTHWQINRGPSPEASCKFHATAPRALFSWLVLVVFQGSLSVWTMLMKPWYLETASAGQLDLVLLRTYTCPKGPEDPVKSAEIGSNLPWILVSVTVLCLSCLQREGSRRSESHDHSAVAEDRRSVLEEVFVPQLANQCARWINHLLLLLLHSPLAFARSANWTTVDDWKGFLYETCEAQSSFLQCAWGRSGH